MILQHTGQQIVIMEVVKKEFTKNRYCIDIVKCCASCVHRLPSKRDGVRLCAKGHGEHYLDYLCDDDWEMNPDLDNAGKGGGRVKRKAFLLMMADAYSGGLISTEQHRMLVEEWRRKYGSEYLAKK